VTSVFSSVYNTIVTAEPLEL